MIYPTKQAYLKYDLLKVVEPQGLTTTTFTGEELAEAISKVTYEKIASKGDKYIWFNTDRKDAGMGWFKCEQEPQCKRYNSHSFYKMPDDWGKHLTESEPYTKEN